MYLYPNISLDDIAFHDFSKIKCHTFGCPWEPQDLNGDSIGIIPISPRTYLVAVADGVGGEAGGPAASRIAIEELANNSSKMRSAKSRTSWIIDSFETSNQKILELGTGAATTLIVFEFSHSGYRFYNSGDSCGAIFSKDGKLLFNTLAHNPIDLGKVAELIEDNIYDQDDTRRYVTNFLGKIDFKIDVVCQRKLPKDSIIVVGSDGLFDNLSLEMLSKIIRETPHPENLAAQIKERCIERMLLEETEYCKPDDLSFIVINTQKYDQ